jgi:hypothetical protein
MASWLYCDAHATIGTLATAVLAASTPVHPPTLLFGIIIRN